MDRTRTGWMWGMALAAGMTGAAWAGGSMKAVNLRCEYRTDPIGIDAARPRLSWVLEAEKPSARGLKQTAYQVLVSGSAAELKAGRGELWDSGKTASDQSIHIEYAGRALASEQDCFWAVRVWDQDGAASEWSPPARWTMGLLDPAGWQAKWIGYDAPAAEDAGSADMKALLALNGSAWIWTGGATAGNQPAGSAFFRKTVELPAGRKIARAVVVMTADDSFRLFVNGKNAGRGDGWQQAKVFDVTARLQPGSNALAVEATNGGQNPTPAGLLGKLVVKFAAGEPLVVPVDATWRSSREATGKWKSDGFDDSAWTPASAIARCGDGPWGEVKADGASAMLPAAYLRKSFTVDKPVRRAVLFASALGVYELHLNGKPLNNDVLSPGWTDYRKRVHYFGYDVTDRLARGGNALGAILGDGWYAAYLAFSGRRHYYGDKPRFIARLRIDYADGTTQVVATDGSWAAAYGAIREGDMLMGCVYDAQLEQPGWDAAAFNAAAWQPAVADEGVKANLEAHPGLPIRRIQELPARTVAEPQPGVYVFDLGQNMVGWARLRAKGTKGQQVVVRHAEMLNPDGTIYTANLRAARATDTYTLDGTDRAYEPYFTFHGFRYVEVTGLEAKPSAGDVTGIVVHSDLARTGRFECSEPLVNKLMENTYWGQRSNFLDVPTDCPQRDERAGWTGDAQVFMKAACFNMDAPAFFTKWLIDLCEDSQRADGAFGDVAPHISIVGFGNTGWADSGVVCNWQMFKMYGDTRVVRAHYPALKRYMDFLARTSKDYVRGTGSYGDWLRLAGPQHSDAIGTAYYFYAARLMTELAAAIGETADAQAYRELGEKIRAAFVQNFIKDDGRIVDAKNETGQTFYALAFGLELVPAERRDAVGRQFVAELEKQKGHLATGFLGTPFVLFALQKAGHADLAYQMVLNQDYPSWLLQVKLGSTTMWERWDGWLPNKGFQDAGMNSFNHYWLGCVGEWLQCAVAGIDTDGPGFARLTIRPTLPPAGQGLTRAHGSYESIHGLVSSAWERKADALSLNVTIPANTTATVFVPAKDAAGVREGGKPAEKAAGLKLLRQENGCAVFEAGSGSYAFESRI